MAEAPQPSTTEPPDDRVLLEKFSEYREMCPSDPEDRIWAAVSEAFDMVGDGARTVASLELATAINPEWGRHRLQLAKAHIRKKEWMRAVSDLDRCADLDASGCDSTFFAENPLYYVGYALWGQGLYKEAAEAWRGAANVVRYWRNLEPLKDFHLHRGWAYHLERDFLDALECYRRAMVAPGPGDTSEDDVMDFEQVEKAQNQNRRIQVFHDMAKKGEVPDASSLDAVAYTN